MLHFYTEENRPIISQNVLLFLWMPVVSNWYMVCHLQVQKSNFQLVLKFHILFWLSAKSCLHPKYTYCFDHLKCMKLSLIAIAFRANFVSNKILKHKITDTHLVTIGSILVEFACLWKVSNTDLWTWTLFTFFMIVLASKIILGIDFNFILSPIKRFKMCAA